MKFTEEMAEEFIKDNRGEIEEFNKHNAHLLNVFELSRFNELYGTEFILKDGLFIGSKY